MISLIAFLFSGSVVLFKGLVGIVGLSWGWLVIPGCLQLEKFLHPPLGKLQTGTPKSGVFRAVEKPGNNRFSAP